MRNEREDIFKFFLFINIYGGINAFYYFFFLFFNIHFYISPYKYKKLEVIVQQLQPLIK